ncbi:MAG: PAS domain S-box protein [Acidobacteria bacterium]|nr:PAS domain S-box protein [Acidobacteriota bacterium]
MNRSPHGGDERTIEACVEPSDTFARTLFDASGEGAFLLDDVILDCNAEACRIFGTVREEMLGKNPGVLSPPKQPDGQDSALFATELIHAALAGAKQTFPWRHRRFDGTEFDAQITLKPIDIAGKRMLFGSIKDVSDRIRAEASAHMSEARLRLIAANSSAGITCSNADDVLVFVNPAFAHMLGYEPAHLVGRSLATIVEVREFERYRQFTGLRERSAISSTYESRLIRSDGRVVDVLVQASPLFSQQGDFEGVVAIVTDLTERKRAEHALLRAKEEAEAATRAKSAFLANMSHEIRTPLNAILGMVELLESSPQDESSRECIGAIKQGGQALLSIVGDVLDLSRIESGQLDVRPTRFDPRAILADVLRTLAPSAQREGITVTCTIEPSVPDSIVSDPTLLRQIVVNLLGNAIKFTKEGGIAIDLGLDDGPDGGAKLILSVIDSGSGIAPAMHARVLEPFVQEDVSTTRKHGGAGLGLAIARRLAQALRGRLWLESAPGRGSCFMVSFATSLADETTHVARSVQVEPPRRSAVSSLPALHVLVVEDNRANQLVACRMLERAGHRFHTASDGVEALLALERESFDLVLMDVQMPRMDGLAATRALREREAISGAHIPVIALTAHALTGDAEICRQAGMDGYVTKPVSWASLAREIDRVLEQIRVPA